MTSPTSYRIRRGPLSGRVIAIELDWFPTDRQWGVTLWETDHLGGKPVRVCREEFKHLVNARTYCDSLTESAKEMSAVSAS